MMSIADTIRELMAERKGILFATEQSGSEAERFIRFGLVDEAARRSLRELLFTAPEIEHHVNGVILSPETVHESTKEGVRFPDFLASKQILTGIVLPASDSEEKLLSALTHYASTGVSFAVFLTDAAIPNESLSSELETRIRSLVVAAKRCHSVGIVPVLGVSIPFSGTHTAEQAEDALLETLSLLGDALQSEEVNPEKLIVAVSMVTAGSQSTRRPPSEEVAERTVRALTTALPGTVGGIVFLSDGETPERATENLNALARLEPLPWPIAFCFSRSLLDPVLAAWRGSEENFAEAQALFSTRLSLLSQADAAGYASNLETPEA